MRQPIGRVNPMVQTTHWTAHGTAYMRRWVGHGPAHGTAYWYVVVPVGCVHLMEHSMCVAVHAMRTPHDNSHATAYGILPMERLVPSLCADCGSSHDACTFYGANRGLVYDTLRSPW